MEYAALFLWLAICLVLGALVHSVMDGALQHRFVQFLAAPGMIVRKFTMTLVVLLCGGTVTRVSIYELSSRDIDYRAEGVASVAKVLVPIAPLFGAAAAMMAVNAMFGHPLRMDYGPPALASFDTGGLKGFADGTWVMLTGIVQQALQGDWHSARLYMLFAVTFSLSLGAAAAVQRVREAMLGAGVLTVTMAVLSSIAVRRVEVLAATPAWFATARTFIFSASAVAFAMMVYGLLGALLVGFGVRVYEMFSRPRARSKSARKVDDESDDRRLAA